MNCLRTIRPINKLRYGFILRQTHNHTPEFLTNDEVSVDNMDVPACYRCKHHNMDNTCGKFAEKNLETGGIELLHVLQCRNDETKCGIKAVLYHEISISKTNSKIIANFILHIGIGLSVCTSAVILCNAIFMG